MHSFRHSRARILFETFCALTIAGSCFGAWTQTGAWAMLPAAAVAGIYGLVHLFDVRQLRPARFVEPQRIALDHESQSDRATDAGSELAAVVAEAPKAAEPAVEAEPAKPKTRRADRPRRTKTMRKGGRRADDQSKPVTAAAPAAPEQDWATSPAPLDDATHSNIEPLFEPEPFVRMPRPAFGRKAG